MGNRTRKQDPVVLPAIAPPRPEQDISDRIIFCEEALEPAFKALVDAAEHAGWRTIDITIAIQSLADHHMLQVVANAETDTQIAFWKQKNSRPGGCRE